MTDLNHKGMRPGILRILAKYPEIQLENNASTKEFKVIIKRIIQKREAATQKRETATQKGQFEDIDTTPKERNRYPKRIWILPKRKYWSTLKTILRQPE